MDSIISIKPTLLVRKGRIRVLVSGLASPVVRAVLRSPAREVAATIVETVDERIILECDVPIADDGAEEFAIHMLAGDDSDLVTPAALEIVGPDFNGE
jgi:hypothetical protein